MSLHRLLSAACGLAFLVSTAVHADEIAVFAAASTTGALDEAGRAFNARTGHTLKPSYASSSTLAKQVEQGAPAQIFISANEKWADYLEERKLLAPGTRTSLLGNSVVLIAPVDSKSPDIKIEKGFDLVAALRGGRLAVGDPDHVPAGMYAKEALTNLGVWDVLERRLARMNDVRSALTLVERGEAPFGIVYATDAAAAKGVRVVGTFPPTSHGKVSYPVAMIAGQDKGAAKAFFDFMASPEGKAVFKRHGFTVN